MFRPDDLIAGGNSLHIAATYNSTCLKKLLVFLKRDSDIVREVIDIKDNLGQTALQLAVKNKDTSAASVLLDFGANIDTKNLKGQTPLHACRTSEMFEFLLQNGADAKLVDTNERAVLEHFIRWNPENANALIADFITTNGKQPSEEDILLIFDLHTSVRKHGTKLETVPILAI
jgi:ankyrin repeat protein